MLVESVDGEHALLGRPRSLKRRGPVLTCLSGFIEQGESIEEAVSFASGSKPLHSSQGGWQQQCLEHSSMPHRPLPRMLNFTQQRHVRVQRPVGLTRMQTRIHFKGHSAVSLAPVGGQGSEGGGRGGRRECAHPRLPAMAHR